MEDFKFLLLTATRFEQENLFNLINQINEEYVDGNRSVSGILFDERVKLIETGIGTVNTAYALTMALATCNPSYVIQFGIGGAYVSSGLKIGDIAIAESEHYGDMGVVTPSGWRDMSLIGIPLVNDGIGKVYNSFSIYSENTVRVESTLSKYPWEHPFPKISTGPFITVNQCSGLQTIGDEISARFEGICENMEGAAAAQICRIRKIPFMEFRSISNLVVDRDMNGWDIPLALSRIQKAVEILILMWNAADERKQ